LLQCLFIGQSVAATVLDGASKLEAAFLNDVLHSEILRAGVHSKVIDTTAAAELPD
jgi:hypothetical protein